jgi:predicted nucleic acid-binding protein
VQPASALLDFNAAYKSAVKAARREDTFVSSIKKTLLAEVQSLNDTIKHVEREQDEAKTRITSLAETALKRAAEIAREKSETLIASQERLSKQLEFIQWAMTVLTPYSDKLSPSQWLRLWANLQQLVKKKTEEENISITNEPEDDQAFIIHLQANLRVNSN